MGSSVQDFNVCRRCILDRFIIHLCIHVLRARALFEVIVSFTVINPLNYY